MLYKLAKTLLPSEFPVQIYYLKQAVPWAVELMKSNFLWFVSEGEFPCGFSGSLSCHESNEWISLLSLATYFHEICRKWIQMNLLALCWIWLKVDRRFTRGWQIGDIKTYKCYSYKPRSWGNWTKRSKGMCTLDFVSSDFDNMLKEQLIRNHKCRFKRSQK